jgi:hypothetical protein
VTQARFSYQTPGRPPILDNQNPRRTCDGIAFAGMNACIDQRKSMRPGALPIQQQILVDLIAPPMGAILWRFVTGGWAGAQNASEETRRRKSTEFWVVLVLGYILMFGISLYTWLV